MRRALVMWCSYLIFLGLCAAGALGATGCSGTSAVLAGTDVAQVGTVAISVEEFQRRVAEFSAELSGQVPDKKNDPAGYQTFENRVLDYMVTLEMVRQKAGSLSVALTSDEVEAKLEQLATESFGGDLTKLEQSLEATGSDVSTYRAELAEQMLIAKARDAVIAKAAPPTDEDIAAYYESHRADYEQPEMRRVRHILSAPRPAAGGNDPTEADWQATLGRAEQVRADLIAGADFASEAKAHSDDTATRDAGGDLGAVSRQQTWPGFEEAVWSLTQDEISPPVKTQYGYEIIQVTAIDPATTAPLDEARDAIRQTLTLQKQEAAWQAWLAGTRTSLPVTIRAGMETTSTS